MRLRRRLSGAPAPGVDSVAGADAEPRRRRLQRRATGLFGVSLALTAVALAAYASGALSSLELSSVNTRFSVRGTQPPPAGVVLVKVDDISFSDLNLRWPFPRSADARLIDLLKRDGARVIAFDVQFTEPSTPDQDNALINSIANAGNVVLATTEADARGHTRVLGGDSVVAQVGARVGDTLLPNDSDGRIRRVEYSQDHLKTFSVVSVERATGHAVSPSHFNDRGTAWIDFRGPPGAVRSVSFSRAAKAPAGFFKNKIVVVGTTAPSLQDVHLTSTSGANLMSGPEIQASAMDTMLRGFPLRHSDGFVDVLLIVLMGMVTPLVSLRLSPLRALAVALFVGALYTLGTQLAFNSGLIVVFVYPLVALALSSVGALGINFVIASFDRERVRDVFARFVSDAVVNQVLQQSGGVRLGGQRLEATVMFSDLRGFTSFAESLDPERVIAILNRYLGEMSEAILDHGGTLVAYMGDGIFAVFGAPVTMDDHADRALSAAREMLSRLRSYNEWMEAQGMGSGFKMGIGLNTGTVMSGNVGSERRLEYAAIGDTTNTSARLEGMTKGTPHQLFFADSTRAALSEQPADLMFVEEMPVRGKQAAIKVWTVTDGTAPAPAEATAAPSAVPA